MSQETVTIAESAPFEFSSFKRSAEHRSERQAELHAHEAQEVAEEQE